MLRFERSVGDADAEGLEQVSRPAAVAPHRHAWVEREDTAAVRQQCVVKGPLVVDAEAEDSAGKHQPIQADLDLRILPKLVLKYTLSTLLQQLALRDSQCLPTAG